MPNFDKIDWLLLVLHAHPLDRIRLLKALFLLRQWSGRNIEGFFAFAPYVQGPSSSDFYISLKRAVDERLVSQALHPIEDVPPCFLTNRGTARVRSILRQIAPPLLQRIRLIANEVVAASIPDLQQRIFAEAPDFAVQSTVPQETRP